MRISIVYVFPATIGQQYTDWAARFVKSYNQYPSGMEHDTIVTLNASKATPAITSMFSTIPNVTFFERSNDAQDIGAYQEAALKFPCDLMVFFGSSVFIRTVGWLERVEKVFEKYGPGLYGAMANGGDVRLHIPQHVRTTGFWTTPDLMNSYPHRITRNDQRYEFEHGQTCFASWVKSQHLPMWLVHDVNEYESSQWNSLPPPLLNISRPEIIFGDRLSESVV